MDKRNLAFGRVNFILLAIGMVIVIIGFILMSGAGSDDRLLNNGLVTDDYHRCG